MKRRLLIQTVILAALFLVSAVLMRGSKNADAFFVTLVACYGATIATSGKHRCFRKSRTESAK